MTAVEYDLSFAHRYECELLEELPGSGGTILYYPGLNTDGGHDGLAVRVISSDRASWIGLFTFGQLAFKGKNGVYACPNERELCVVSRGDGYIVQVDHPERYQRVVASPVMDVRPLIERGLIVFADPWELYAYGMQGLVWRTGRLSPEGVTITNVTGDYLYGEVDAWDEQPQRFVIDVRTGQVLS